jgi:hypothetical protein
MPELGERMPPEHRRAIAEAHHARNEWLGESRALRKAVYADDEELAVLLLRRILRARREEAQAEAEAEAPRETSRTASANGSTPAPQRTAPRLSQRQREAEAAKNGRPVPNGRVTPKRTK